MMEIGKMDPTWQYFSHDGVVALKSLSFSIYHAVLIPVVTYDVIGILYNC